MTENKPGNQQSEFDMLTEIRARLPDCMAPDGAEPCGAFRELHDRVVELEASHFRLADAAILESLVRQAKRVHYWTGRGTLCSLDNSRKQQPNHTDNREAVTCKWCLGLLAYHELLYAVATKHPGESRHQTALRYIREREAPRPDQIAASSGDSNG